MILSKFEVIDEAVQELSAEISRICGGEGCIETIPCADLDSVLFDIRHSTLQLRRIKMSGAMSEGGCMGDTDSVPSKGYLDDPEFIDAVRLIFQIIVS